MTMIDSLRESARGLAGAVAERGCVAPAAKPCCGRRAGWGLLLNAARHCGCRAPCCLGAQVHAVLPRRCGHWRVRGRDKGHL